MENTGEKLDTVGEPINIGETETISIEKPKKPRKKRETQSPAQLETLKRGREKLAEKRRKQVEEKKQAPVIDDMMKTFEKRCTEMMQSFEQRVHQTKITPKNTPEENDTRTPVPPKIQRIFV